ncbi:MAG: polysaccharide deacetylase family protein [Bacteroidota bacterium]|nr:polysaccharide deacetylase family protein [Bacteroidota bacterium]
MITHTGKIHQLLFPSLLWRMPSKKIFLTFDDGPHLVATPIVLDVLKKHGVKATFFLTGENIATREALIKRIAAEGHSIGIHAYHHTRALAFSKKQTKEEILHTLGELRTLTPQKIRLFRPPFGFFSWNTIAAARELGFVLVMWSCLTGDFRNWNIEKVVQTALHKLQGGSILVFHDNTLTENKIENILERVIMAAKEQGFEFGAIR